MLVPGFTQTPSSWDGVVAALDRDADVIAASVGVAPTFAESAAAIGEQHGAGVYVGYSMGGRLCLRLALDAPTLVHGLVLVSASPGLRDPVERDARRAADEELARAAERDGVDAFLTRWLAQPLFATVPPDAPGLADRRTLTAAHLAACLRVLGTGSMEPLWHRLGELRVPVMLVTGTQDEKFDRLAVEMAAMIPRARHTRVECGHAVPQEQPAALARVLARFTASLDG